MEPTPVEMIPLFGMVLGIGLVITIVVVTSYARTRRLQIQSELQAKLIDKFGSTPELIAFLQSPAGREFVTGVQSGPVRRVRDKAASAVRLGIMFTAFAVGFLVLWPLTNTPGLAWPGVLLFVMGLAYFGSAYSLMRFNAEPDAPAAQPPVTQE